MSNDRTIPDPNNPGKRMCVYTHAFNVNDPPATRFTTYVYVCKRCGANIAAVCPNDVTPTFALCKHCVEAVMSGRVMREHEGDTQ